MSETVIKVANLSKKYILAHQQTKRNEALREVMTRGVKNFGKKLIAPFSSSTTPHLNNSTEEFYALKDINFEIKLGDRVGIIGRNGAGKSTLLKILNRITEPTNGRIEIEGRVASLLEVGTGFHPDLTGRENIFLNGAIMGMTNAEIKRNFDEIVTFSEIEKFLDTPVKRYSSGMYMRLAFAVVAHMEPEILIVDEVLAVGDAKFQKKCLGKMEEVGRKGRTVLFVSHNMGIVNNFCNTCFLLDKGQLVSTGTTADIIRQYELTTMSSFSEVGLTPGILFSNNAIDTDKYGVLEVSLVDKQGNPIQQIKTFNDCTFKIKFNSPEVKKDCSVHISIQTVNGIIILRLATRPDSNLDIDFKQGINTVCCHLKKLPLPAGTYLLGFGLALPMLEWLLLDRELCFFDVGNNDIHGSGFPPIQEHALSVVDYYWESLY
jgi:lipopolysaccharide transport system ATP-binding protein